MTKYLQILCLCSMVVLILTSVVFAPVLASQTVPLPNTASASYHPGLFGQGCIPAHPETIPPVVNTYEGTQNKSSYIERSVNYSYFPGDTINGKAPSVAGYVSGIPLNASVNISGRVFQNESFRYLATVSPDDQGIFIWTIPEWASNLTEFVADIAQ